jgi:hypothetical protein
MHTFETRDDFERFVTASAGLPLEGRKCDMEKHRKRRRENTNPKKVFLKKNLAEDDNIQNTTITTSSTNLYENHLFSSSMKEKRILH